MTIVESEMYQVFQVSFSGEGEWEWGSFIGKNLATLFPMGDTEREYFAQ